MYIIMLIRGVRRLMCKGRREGPSYVECRINLTYIHKLICTCMWTPSSEWLHTINTGTHDVRRRRVSTDWLYDLSMKGPAPYQKPRLLPCNRISWNIVVAYGHLVAQSIHTSGAAVSRSTGSHIRFRCGGPIHRYDCPLSPHLTWWPRREHRSSVLSKDKSGNTVTRPKVKDSVCNSLNNTSIIWGFFWICLSWIFNTIFVFFYFVWVIFVQHSWADLLYIGIRL